MTAVATELVIREAQGGELMHWDGMVRRFGNHRVTHTRAWIESLVACGFGEALYLVFRKDGEVVGCLPGLVSSVGPWRLFGSPRAGWQTVSMGPAFDPARVSAEELMSALVPFLEKRHRVACIEIMHAGLDPAVMRAMGFSGKQVATYRAPLWPHDEPRSFKAWQESARRNVRRAARLNLVVRLEQDEHRFVNEHYDQVREVYLRGGHAVPFSQRRVRECFRHLQAADALLAPAVYLPGGRVCIASGMFFLAGNELSLWTWAHRGHYRWYRATELMTWTVLQRAIAAGCESFDLMGRAAPGDRQEFKAKFGAELDWSKWRWVRARPRWLRIARDVAGLGFHGQQAIRGQAIRALRTATAKVVHRGNGKARAPACVLGDVDLVRALGLAGIPSVVVVPPGKPARFSRFTRAALDWVEPWDQAERLVERLVAHGQAQPEPPVLFYQEDRSLLLVSRYRDRLREAFRFVIPDAKLVEQVVDKQQFQDLAARLQLPVPPARALRPGNEPLPADLGLQYPLILKPLVRRLDSWQPIAGRAKAIRLTSPQELGALWPRLAAAHMAVLVQEIVSGSEAQIESYHTYVDERGTVVAEFTGRKIRTYPTDFGDSSAIEITDAADVIALGRQVIGRLGLSGVAKLDFKRDADGRLHLFEVNPRFTLWHHPGAVAGVNIPALVYGDLTAAPRPQVTAVRGGVRWCKVWIDWPAARDHGVPFRRWLAWALGCEAKGALAWDDPLPLVAAGALHLGRRLHAKRGSQPTAAEVSPALRRTL